MPAIFLEFKEQIIGKGYAKVFSVTIFRVPVLNVGEKDELPYLQTFNYCLFLNANISHCSV